MKYPLIPLCITFCLGILFASHLDISFQVLYLLAFLLLISSIIFVKKDSKFSISILTVFFLLGSLLLKNSWVLPDCHIANFTPYKSESIKLVGTVENDPICREKNISFILNAERFQPKVDPLKAEGKDKTWHAACGRVLVRLYEKNTFSYADKLLLKGKLYRPFSFSKDFDYRSDLRNQGIYYILTVK